MKPHGDVPEDHRILAEGLIKMETAIDSSTLSVEDKARSYVFLSSDWLQIGMEEETNRLLVKAEEVCDGYFLNFMRKHYKEDENYAMVANSLSKELMWILIERLKNVK